MQSLGCKNLNQANKNRFKFYGTGYLDFYPRLAWQVARKGQLKAHIELTKTVEDLLLKIQLL